jgi:Flp pilus assembly CpaF family ATPase
MVLARQVGVVMQGIVLGMTGSGKTTLLKNIITQDLARMVGTPNDPIVCRW